jgi:hypothetical protein
VESDLDERLRLAAMAWLRARALVTGGPITSAELRSFTF